MKNISIWILFGGGIIALFSWTLALHGLLWDGVTVNDLEPLYTGLGFVGLLATFWHERSKSEDADSKHDQLVTVMTDQARAAHELILENKQSTRAHALIARIGCYTTQMNEAKHGTPLFRELQEQRQSLLVVLDKLMK